MSKPDTSTHSLNRSTAKMTYSFPKADRFLPIIKPTCDLFYELPLQRNRRAASFGIGAKLNSQLNTSNPSPATYAQPSLFQAIDKKRRGFSFGYGREILGGPLDNSKHSGEGPGPGTYSLVSAIDIPTITLKQKIPDLDLKRKYYIPGPGTYDPPSLINASGRYISSNHVNSRVGRFSLSKSPLQLSHKKSPGPGNCNEIIIQMQQQKVQIEKGDTPTLDMRTRWSEVLESLRGQICPQSTQRTYQVQGVSKSVLKQQTFL